MIWYGLLDFWTFVWKNQTINPIFFDEFGSKRTLLDILVVFWTWVG